VKGGYAGAMPKPTVRWPFAPALLVAAVAVSHPVLGGTFQAPTLTKSFSVPSINAGGAADLTFTLSNPQGAPAVSTVTFTDTLPTGLQVASNTVGGTCSNAAAATILTIGGGSIAVSNLQVPDGGTLGSACVVVVSITNVPGQFNASCGTNPAAFTNSSSNITSSSGVINGVQPSCLVVIGPTQTPTNTPPAPTQTPTNTPAAPTLTPTNTPAARGAAPAAIPVLSPGMRTVLLLALAGAGLLLVRRA